MTQIRAVILGAQHPHVFQRIDLLHHRSDIELLGFIELDDAIAERLTTVTGLGRLPLSVLPSVDLAIIEALDRNVPSLSHLALDASIAGMLLEKPGAAEPNTFFDLAARLSNGDTIVEMGYQLHYSDAIAWCREIVRDHVLGDITTCRFHGGCPAGAGAELWQSLPENLGGVMYTEGCHLLEMVFDLFGLPLEVSSSVRRLPRSGPLRPLEFKPDLFSGPSVDVEVEVGSLVHEDVAAAILEYPGCLVTVDVTAWEPTAWCTQWWIEIYGINGSLIAVPEPGELRLLLRESAGRWPVGETILRAATDATSVGFQTAYARQLESLIARVTGSMASNTCGLEHGVAVMQILDSIYSSAASRSWVRPADIRIAAVQ